MAPGSGVSYGTSRKPGRLLEYSDLTSACGALQGGPYTSQANRGNNMEKNDLNKSMCEGLFGGKLEVTVVPDCFEKSDARWQKNCLYETLQIAMKRISTIEEMVQKMDEFCRIKKTHGGLGRIIWKSAGKSSWQGCETSAGPKC